MQNWLEELKGRVPLNNKLESTFRNYPASATCHLHILDTRLYWQEADYGFASAWRCRAASK